MEKILERLMNKLYDTKWNLVIYSNDIIKDFWVDEDVFEKLITTPSIHKNYIELDKFIIKLLPKWRYYIEEKRKPIYKRIISHINEMSTFYTLLIALFALMVSVIAIFKN